MFDNYVFENETAKVKSSQTDLAAVEPSDCLVPTRLLDLDDSRLRLRAKSLTQLAQTDVQKAVRVHDFVKSLPFGCVGGFDHVSAAAVLKKGRGDCHTKGTLFVALLRSAGVPARLRFVSLPAAFLWGIVDLGNSVITHAVGEVYLQGHWVQTDTYVTDSVLEAHAALWLRQQQRVLGYGIHEQASRFWDGQQDAHGQYHAADASSQPVNDWGVSHDPEHFYSSKAHPELHRSWLTRAKWVVAAGVINRRTGQLRSTAPAAVWQG